MRRALMGAVVLALGAAAVPAHSQMTPLRDIRSIHARATYAGLEEVHDNNPVPPFDYWNESVASTAECAYWQQATIL